MLNFLIRNISLFVCLLLLLAIGNVSVPFAGFLLLIWMLVWALKGKEIDMILLFACIIILGDSRLTFFLPFKDMRIVSISILFLKVAVDILQKKYPFNRLIYLSIPFFIIALLGVTLSPTPVLAISKTFSYFFLLVICLSSLPYYFKKDDNRLLFDIMYLAILAYIIGFIFILINTKWAYLNFRYRGIFGNPNGLGIFSSLMIPFGYMLQSKFPEKTRTVWLLIGLGVFSILLSESRTAFGSVGLFFGLYFIYKGGRFRRNLFWFFGLPLVVFIFSVIPLETLLDMIGLGEFLRVESIKTGTGRFLAWGLGLTEIQQNLWLGRGFGYEQYFFFQLREFLITTEHQGGMHNSYLTFLMNNGVLGVIPFVIFLLTLFNRVKVKRFGFPFIIIMLISANFESWLNSSLNAFTFFFFLIISFLIQYNNFNKPTLNKPLL